MIINKEDLLKLEVYTEDEAKRLLSALGLDNKSFKYLFDRDGDFYAKLQNFDFVVNALLLLKVSTAKDDMIFSSELNHFEEKPKNFYKDAFSKSYNI